MKLPICTFCAKTGMLCSNCKAKKENNEITQLDIDISAVLVKNQNNKSIHKIKFYNSIDTPDLMILVGDNSLKNVLATNKQLSSSIDSVSSKSFEVIAKKGTVKDTLTSLFTPVEISGIDEIFVPDGTKEIRINLRGEEKDLPLNSDVMILIASKITDSFIRIEYVN